VSGSEALGNHQKCLASSWERMLENLFVQIHHPLPTSFSETILTAKLSRLAFRLPFFLYLPLYFAQIFEKIYLCIGFGIKSE
jgi:hypothetical protein